MNDPTMKKEVIQGDYFEGRDENGRYHPDNPNQDFWKEDTYMTGNPAPDTISFASTDTGGFIDPGTSNFTVAAGMVDLYRLMIVLLLIG